MRNLRTHARTHAPRHRMRRSREECGHPTCSARLAPSLRLVADGSCAQSVRSERAVVREGRALERAESQPTTAHPCEPLSHRALSHRARSHRARSHRRTYRVVVPHFISPSR